MPLHPQVEDHLARLAAINFAGLHTVSPERARDGARRLTALSAASAEPVAEVSDRLLNTPTTDVPVRIYRPVAQSAQEGLLPVVIFFHGGGYVLGDLDSHDALARSLTNGAHAVVVSVDYPLAPEHKYPAQVDAGFAATTWIAEHAAELGVDPERLAVAGDSAGGNLAAVVTLKARESGGPRIALQLLIYPDLDFRRDNRSITELAGEYGNITREAQAWFMDHYLRDAGQRLDPRVSPVLERDLTGLPPAYIVTAEYDALRDEGEQYGAQLAEAGVPVTVRRYDGMIHEFLRHPFDDSTIAIADITKALSQAFEAARTS